MDPSADASLPFDPLALDAGRDDGSRALPPWVPEWVPDGAPPQRFLVELVDQEHRRLPVPRWILFDAVEGSYLPYPLYCQAEAQELAGVLDRVMDLIRARLAWLDRIGADLLMRQHLRAHAEALPSWVLAAYTADFASWGAIRRELALEHWRIELADIPQPDVRDAVGRVAWKAAWQMTNDHAQTVEEIVDMARARAARARQAGAERS